MFSFLGTRILKAAKFFFSYPCSLAKHFDWESHNAEKACTMEFQTDSKLFRSFIEWLSQLLATFSTTGMQLVPKCRWMRVWLQMCIFRFVSLCSQSSRKKRTSAETEGSSAIPCSELCWFAFLFWFLNFILTFVCFLCFMHPLSKKFTF